MDECKPLVGGVWQEVGAGYPTIAHIAFVGKKGAIHDTRQVEERYASGRVLHSSTFQFNLSRLCH